MDVHDNGRMRAAAVSLARLGMAVIPCYGIIREDGDDGRGVCSCHKRGDCSSPGKHPMGRAWETGASNDPAVVEGWDCWTSQPGLNLGVVWGAKSGVIDVEFDGEEGRRTIEELGLADIETPTFRSSRSVHRLFRWQDGLPATAVMKVAGLEIRIGGGGKASQSIAPPSRHASGVDYEWVEDRSPWEVGIAEIPEVLLALIRDGLAGVGEERAEKISPPAGKIYSQPAGAGERHSSLLRLATRKFFDLRDMNDRGAVDRVLDELRLVNQTQCRPPKPDSDVVNVWQSAYQYVNRERSRAPVEEAEIPRKVQEAVTAAGRWQSRAEATESEARAAEAKAAAVAEKAAAATDEDDRKMLERKAAVATRAAEKARERADKIAARAASAAGKAEEARLEVDDEPVRGAPTVGDMMAEMGASLGMESAGLVYDRESGEWFPGSWRLEIVKSDPIVYRLVIPRNGGELRIELDVEGIIRPATVASGIRAATGEIMVDLVPGIWPAAWKGTAPKKKKPGKAGLLAKLMAAVEWVEPVKGLDNRIGAVAAAFRDALLKAHERADFPAEDDDDVVAGMASRHGGFFRDGGEVRLFFRWPAIWQAATAIDPTLTEGDSRSLRRRLAEAGSRIDSKVFRVGEQTVRLAFMTRAGYEALSMLCEE
jgi:hypothetical protein